MLVAAILGFALGFIGSIPVAGPIAVLVVARAMSERFKSAFFIAVGAGIAEGLYAALAFWGFGALLEGNPWIEPVTRGAGAVILAILGVVLMRHPKPKPEGAPPPRKTRGYGSFAIGFTITAVNPTLIATWTAAVTAIYGSGAVTFSPKNAVAFSLGTMVGIIGWSSTLLGAMWKMRQRFRPDILAKTRRATGVLVLGLAVFFIYRFVTYFVH